MMSSNNGDTNTITHIHWATTNTSSYIYDSVDSTTTNYVYNDMGLTTDSTFDYSVKVWNNWNWSFYSYHPLELFNIHVVFYIEMVNNYLDSDSIYLERKRGMLCDIQKDLIGGHVYIVVKQHGTYYPYDMDNIIFEDEFDEGMSAIVNAGVNNIRVLNRENISAPIIIYENCNDV